MPRTYVRSRAEFFSVLESTLEEVTQLTETERRVGIWKTIKAQLEAMTEWSADGRAPTAKERQRLTIGIIVVRELEPAYDPGLYRLTQRLHELSGYFYNWE